MSQRRSKYLKSLTFFTPFQRVRAVAAARGNFDTPRLDWDGRI